MSAIHLGTGSPPRPPVLPPSIPPSPLLSFLTPSLPSLFIVINNIKFTILIKVKLRGIEHILEGCAYHSVFFVAFFQIYVFESPKYSFQERRAQEIILCFLCFYFLLPLSFCLSSYLEAASASQLMLIEHLPCPRH